MLFINMVTNSEQGTKPLKWQVGAVSYILCQGCSTMEAPHRNPSHALRQPLSLGHPGLDISMKMKDQV